MSLTPSTIVPMENVYMGTTIQLSVSWTAAGWRDMDFTTSIPDVSGYTKIGLFVSSVSTYRIKAVSARGTSTGIAVSFYASDTGATSGSVYVVPLYKRSA